MCPCRYVTEDDALEVATGDAVVIKEHIVAVLCQILEDSECPRNIGATVFSTRSISEQSRPSPETTELNDTRIPF
jgi:hypothetical protein